MKTYKHVITFLFISSLSSPVALASLSEFDRGRCEILAFHAEETCVELVCGDTDRASITDCRDSGELPQVMGSCHPQMLKDAVRSYNLKAPQSPVTCTGVKYQAKFR